MKKISALAAVGLSAFAVTAAAAPSNAAPAPTAGNLQHSTMKFVCLKGEPNYLLAVRAVKTPEKSVTAYQVEKRSTATVGPVTTMRAAYFFSTINQAGRTVTLKVTGNTTGSTFTVTGRIPMTCAGLPMIDGRGNVLMPKKMPVMPKTPTMPKAPVMPKAAGPKVQTDYVAPQDNTSTELAAGAFALVALGGGSAAYARRSSRR